MLYETVNADWMISIGVLLGYWVSEDSHSCWYLVALQACWIRSGVGGVSIVEWRMVVVEGGGG